jgi:hypothetical protein
MKLTDQQMDALFQVYLKWQDKTPSPIMLSEFETVSIEAYESEFGKGTYLGIWVGGEPGKPGAMYLGIESNGHTHS